MNIKAIMEYKVKDKAKDTDFLIVEEVTILSISEDGKKAIIARADGMYEYPGYTKNESGDVFKKADKIAYIDIVDVADLMVNDEDFIPAGVVTKKDVNQPLY